jgi:hypothetical protein
MATGPAPETYYQYVALQWTTAVVLSFVAVFAAIMAFKMYRLSRIQHKNPQQQLQIRNLIVMLLWAGGAFVALSVLVHTVFGPTLALLGDRLGLGYTQPLTISFNILVLGVLLFLVAGVIALITRKPSKRDERKAAKTVVNTGTHEHVDH